MIQKTGFSQSNFHIENCEGLIACTKQSQKDKRKRYEIKPKLEI